MDDRASGEYRVARWAVGGILVLYGLSTSGWRRWLGLTLGTTLLQGAAAGIVENHIEAHLANDKPLVDETSEESFPASDPPSWTAGGSSR